MLNEAYTIAGVTRGAEDLVLPQVLPQLTALDSCTIEKTSQEQHGTRVATVFFDSLTRFGYQGNFLFSSESKIRELNIVDTAEIQTVIKRVLHNKVETYRKQ
ncbi:hypothetical protein [Flavobacterium cerinum]|uniref:Uncharacterized protein n=1 Tax=Flavobacterium cerinum TaxID=2502784 RepID=A0A3S3QA13_9FLAO|nr:hypothetical protein [Flavobacterium cerinum]RWW96720.1 hypothetical protein EPI11_14090 [Flavobacterium cerinum]